MSSCTHDCNTCGEDCASRKSSPADFLEKPHESTNIKKVIGIVSGKGGVGKSLVTSLLATVMRRREYDVAVLDADVTGPSIPRAFGLKEKAMGSESGIFPVMTKTGIKVMSVNLLLDDDTAPVVWRGPVIAGTVKQFWTDVLWDDVDFMFVDMPPGTGDVPLTVFQSIPLSGIIVVATPQELVNMIVEKAMKMAGMMNIPVLGLVQNMSYVECPDCGKRIDIFGESKLDAIAQKYQIPVLAKLPVNPSLAQNCDQGVIELFEGTWMDGAADVVESLLGE